VGALLLVWAGGAKALRPTDTARALHAAHLPGSPALVRALAATEVALGVGAIVIGGTMLDGALAATYALFAVFVAVALARGWSLASCGCFGEPDAAPTRLHAVAVSVLSVFAAVAAARGGPAPVVMIARHPGTGVALVVTAVVTAGLLVTALTRLPLLRAET
jgi:hypothetical protein